MTLATTAVSNFSQDYEEYGNDEVYANSFFEQLANALNVYYTPVLVFLGCTGNLMSIIVFYKSKLRLQSTSQYLSALALSDTLFLLQLVPPWLKTVEMSSLFSRNGFCQAFVYMSYVTCNHSSWLVVAFTVERFVAVAYPLRRNATCTVKRARYVIASLAALALLVNLPVLRFAVSTTDCNIDGGLMEHAARFNIFDTMFSFTLPLAIIVVLNSWIVARVYRVGRARRQLTGPGPGAAAAVAPPGLRCPIRGPASLRSQQRVTRMLLTVSSVFVLLNLPAYTMRIVAYANNMDEHEYSGNLAAMQEICLLLFNTNFGINFYLYCLSGQNFRRALCHTFPWLRQRNLTVAVRRDTFHRPARASSNSNSYATTNNTEASNYGTTTGSCAVVSASCHRRNRYKGRVISVWKFNNQRNASQDGPGLELVQTGLSLREEHEHGRWTEAAVGGPVQLSDRRI